MAFAYKQAAISADRRALRAFEAAREFQAYGRLRLSGRVTMLLSLVAPDCVAALGAFQLGVEVYLALTGQGPDGRGPRHTAGALETDRRGVGGAYRQKLVRFEAPARLRPMCTWSVCGFGPV